MATAVPEEEENIEDEERDTIPAYIIRAAEISPKHHRLQVDAHYPRMFYDEISPSTSQYSSLWGASHSRRVDRRMSDPGRLSVSPIRNRTRIGSCISDQHLLQSEAIEEESVSMGHPRLMELRTGSPSEDEHFPDYHNLLVNRSRSREKSYPGMSYIHRRRAQRSMSLPCTDATIMEIGEAIGALALKSPTMPYKAELTPPSRRRRSVSIEPNSLEAIAEEGSFLRGVSRRYSTSQVNL